MLQAIMPKNMHSLDRLVRLGIGFALVLLVFTGPQTPWGWLGLILVATGLLGSCPIYTVFGLSTCRMKAG